MNDYIQEDEENPQINIESFTIKLGEKLEKVVNLKISENIQDFITYKEKTLSVKGGGKKDSKQAASTRSVRTNIQGEKKWDVFVFHLIQSQREGTKTYTARSVLMLILLLYNFFLLIFRLTFMVPFKQNFLDYFVWNIVFIVVDCIGDIVNLVDFVLGFYTPFYNAHGFFSTDPKLIVKNRFKNDKIDLVIGILSVLPLDYFGYASFLIVSITLGNYEWIKNYLIYVPTLRTIKLFKSIKISPIFSYFESHVYSKLITPGYIRIVKYLTLVVLISHFMGCIMYTISSIESLPLLIIVTEISNFSKRHIVSQYFFFMHWCYVLITGYGGTIPGSFIQISYVVVVVIVGIIINISIIGIISSIFGSFLNEGSEKRQNFEKVKLYIKYKGINNLLKKRILGYYSFMFTSRRQWNEQEIINDLPGYLRTELAINMNEAIIKKVNLFQNSSKQFISSVVVKLASRFVLPNQKIIREGDVGREMFFLTSGRVNIVVKEKIVASLEDGTFFGEIALLKRTKRTATVQAATFCDLYILTKESFEELEKMYPLDVGKIRIEAKKREDEMAKKKKDEKK